jgi:hypothetical protein
MTDKDLVRKHIEELDKYLKQELSRDSDQEISMRAVELLKAKSIAFLALRIK